MVNEKQLVAMRREIALYDSEMLQSKEQWYLYGITLETELFSLARETLWSLAAVLLITLAAGILSAVFLARKLTRPILLL